MHQVPSRDHPDFSVAVHCYVPNHGRQTAVRAVKKRVVVAKTEYSHVLQRAPHSTGFVFCESPGRAALSTGVQCEPLQFSIRQPGWRTTGWPDPQSAPMVHKESADVREPWGGGITGRKWTELKSIVAH